MFRFSLVILTGTLLFYQIPVFADAEMFRPFECDIEDCRGKDINQFSWDFINREQYVIRRDTSGSWFTKQDYFNQHCGNAYINCAYPDQDYPIYNGPPYFHPRR